MTEHEKKIAMRMGAKIVSGSLCFHYPEEDYPNRAYVYQHLSPKKFAEILLARKVQWLWDRKITAEMNAEGTDWVAYNRKIGSRLYTDGWSRGKSVLKFDFPTAALDAAIPHEIAKEEKAKKPTVPQITKDGIEAFLEHIKPEVDQYIAETTEHITTKILDAIQSQLEKEKDGAE